MTDPSTLPADDGALVAAIEQAHTSLSDRGWLYCECCSKADELFAFPCAPLRAAQRLRAVGAERDEAKAEAVEMGKFADETGERTQDSLHKALDQLGIPTSHYGPGKWYDGSIARIQQALTGSDYSVLGTVKARGHVEVPENSLSVGQNVRVVLLRKADSPALAVPHPDTEKEAAQLREAVNKIAGGEWLIGSWWLDTGFCWRVNVRDEPSKHATSTTYSGTDFTGAPPADAALAALRAAPGGNQREGDTNG